MIEPSDFDNTEDSVVILAPIGQDAKLAGGVLAQQNIRSESVSSLEELCVRLDKPAAAVLITEEVLTNENYHLLKDKLRDQEPWSDLPVLLLTADKKQLFSSPHRLDHFALNGNISLLERPLRMMTLLTAVRVALRARMRQYQVRELLQEQGRSLRQRDEFLSIASHELKTPITSLKLQVQMRRRFINRNDPTVYLPEKVNSLIATTEHQVNRLSRLVDDMLDISRIDNGQLALHYESCNLSELVSQVLETFSANFQSVGSTVDFNGEDNVVGSWDRYRVEQVVANIFTNAIKYAPGKPVEVEVLRKNNTALLKIRDHGMGISKKDADKIFVRYERASHSNNVSGLGLGLYISKQILEMHNGTINVESKLGDGTTFIVALPLLSLESGNAIHD